MPPRRYPKPEYCEKALLSRSRRYKDAPDDDQETIGRRQDQKQKSRARCPAFCCFEIACQREGKPQPPLKSQSSFERTPIESRLTELSTSPRAELGPNLVSCSSLRRRHVRMKRRSSSIRCICMRHPPRARTGRRRGRGSCALLRSGWAKSHKPDRRAASVDRCTYARGRAEKNQPSSQPRAEPQGRARGPPACRRTGLIADDFQLRQAAPIRPLDRTKQGPVRRQIVTKTKGNDFRKLDVGTDGVLGGHALHMEGALQVRVRSSSGSRDRWTCPPPG